MPGVALRLGHNRIRDLMGTTVRRTLQTPSLTEKKTGRIGGPSQGTTSDSLLDCRNGLILVCSVLPLSA
jgi:hypothetical protein